MIEVTNCCAIKAVLTSDRTEYKKMEINTDFFQNQDFLIGKRIGDKFKKCELLKLSKDTETEYEITDIQIHSERDKKIQQLILMLRENYNFEGFIHTTELNNFKSIIKEGRLISRNSLLSRKINFKDRANHDVLLGTNDYVKSCCRFYYTYDTPTNYRACYGKKVSMVFDEALAYNSKAKFAPQNACFGKFSCQIENVLKYDWEGIFERGCHSSSKYSKQYEGEELKRKIVATRNAEFLIYGEVPISFIKKIIVYDKNVYEEMRSICDDSLFKKVVLREE